MAVIKNRYSFLQAVDGTYVLYDQRIPVVDQIEDCTVSKTVYTDPQGVVVNSYDVVDPKLYQYLDKQLSKFNTNRKTVRVNSTPTPRGTFSFTKVETHIEQIELMDSITKASQQQQQNADTSYQMQTVRQGYGEIPDGYQVDQLTGNTKDYGGELGSLVYPCDLVTNQTGYNGCYTVFFISEHPKSSIAKLSSLALEKDFYNSAEKGGIQSIGNQVDQDQVQKLAIGAASLGAGALFGRYAGKAIEMASGLKSGAQGLSPAAAQLAAVGSAAAGAVGGAGVAMLADKFKDQISVLQNNTNYKRLNMAIALPTPKLEDKHVLKWDGSHGATLGGGVLQMMTHANFKGSGDTANELTHAAAQTNARGESIGNALGNALGPAADALLTKALADSNNELGTTIAALSGKAVNPRKEQLFNEVEFRTFTMSFDLAARNTTDMKNIESIIRVFKYHAYPELTQGNYMWIYPAHFDIVHYYRNQVNTHMPRHATSVLTNIDVDYAGGQSFISVHHDGSPVMIRLTLTFVEMAILSRDSIKKGY